MSEAIINPYREYFRQLAIRHKDLLHDPYSESGDSDIGAKHFVTWNVDQVITGLRTKAGRPLLLLENYEIVTHAQTPSDIKGFYSGAFSVIDTALNNDYSSEDAAFVKTERIVMDILQQIWADHYAPGVDRCNTPFKEFYFDQMNIVPIGPLYDNDFGYRVEFQFRPQLSLTISQKPAAGTFIDISESNSGS